MLPLHFGKRDRLLFGAYTPAVARRRGAGVVVCNPWGAESLRAHRSLKLLADRAASAGVDVLRFDYYGTGDSFGDGAGVRVAGLIDDASAAIDELRAVAGVDKVALVGLRLGANVAAAARARRAEAVDRLVLWEPVVSGADYLRELSLNGDAPPSDTVEVDGFPLSRAFRDDLTALTLRPQSDNGCRVLVALGRAPSGGRAEGIDASGLTLATVPSPRCWVEERDFGAGAVPAQMIDAIVGWLT